MALYCKDHSDKQYEMYCTDCSSLVCLLCIENTHSCHKFISKKKLKEEKIAEINQNRQYLSERLDEYRGILETERERNEQLDKMQESEEQKITQRTETLHQEIDAAKCKYTMELKDFVRKEKENIDSKTSNITGNLNILERVLDPSSNTNEDEMIAIYANCNISDFRVCSLHLEPRDFPSFEFNHDADFNELYGHLRANVDVTDDSDILGEPCLTLQGDDVNNIKCTVAKDGDGLSNSRSQQVAVVDEKKILRTSTIKLFFRDDIKKQIARLSSAGNNTTWVSASGSNKVHLCHKSSARRYTFTIKGDVFDIDVNEEGHVLFTVRDGCSVWKDTRFLFGPSKIVTFDDQTTTYGIRATDAEEFLVCLHKRQRGGKIARASENGTVLQYIEFDNEGSSICQWPRYVHKNKVTGDILIIDERKIIAVDNLGSRKFTISGDTYQAFEEKNRYFSSKQFMPMDLEITKNGNIIVSDYGMKRICMFDRDGQFMKILLNGQGRPTGISLDEEEQLWIALENGEIHLLSNMEPLELPTQSTAL